MNKIHKVDNCLKEKDRKSRSIKINNCSLMTSKCKAKEIILLDRSNIYLVFYQNSKYHRSDSTKNKMDVSIKKAVFALHFQPNLQSFYKSIIEL